MAWTAPITFVANSVLTAAQLNSQLRDNMLETAPAKATQSGSLIVGSGMNQIAERIPQIQRVDTSETTVSTSYTDLATPGPSVTVTTGTGALILTACTIGNNTANASSFMSWTISGATTRSTPLDKTAVRSDGMNGASNALTMSTVDYFQGLTPGTSTFTCQYKVGSGTGVFSNRFIAVMPL